MTDKTPAVFVAIAAVQSDLSKVGIEKARKNQQQGYSFRGIDDVYAAIAPLLAKHGLCIIQRVLSRTCTERQTKNGGALFYTTVQVEYTVAAVADGSTVTACVFGEAMDSGDKSTNKALSAAYKYLCLQLFCIPTEGDNDADATTHEVMSKKAPAPARAPAFDLEKAVGDINAAPDSTALKAVATEYWKRAPENLRGAIKSAHAKRAAELDAQ